MKFLSLIMYVLCCPVFLAFAGNDLSLVPYPKEISLSRELYEIPENWQIEKGPRAAEWLREDFPAILELKVSGDGTGVVRFEKEAKTHPEAYALSVKGKTVVIRAASEEGFFRGAGRLIALLKQAWTVDGRRKLPEITISDYPDFPVRGMTLQMPFTYGLSYSGRLYSIRKTLDAMAISGFNLVILEVGGSFNSVNHKSIRRMPWQEKDLSYLAEYASKRGLTPIPGMNTFGHVARAADICPIRNAFGEVIGMDVRKDEFFARYATVLDELLRIFNNPPYFHIGCDENEELFKLIAPDRQTGSRIFADTVNRISKYLKSKNCRTVIWHDMMKSDQDELTADAVNLLSRDVIIDCWLYDERQSYPEVDYFQGKGFETWVTPWDLVGNIEAFIKYAGRKNVKGVIGSTWNGPHKETTAYLLTAEFSWNKDIRVTYNPVYEFLKLQQDVRRISKPENLTSVKFGGARDIPAFPRTFDFSGGSFSSAKALKGGEAILTELKSPDEFTTLKAQNPDAILALVTESLSDEMLLVDTLNQERTPGSVIIYTPAFGKSTKTNKWGLDREIRNGQVTTCYLRKSDPPIPSDGYVITSHGGTKRKSWIDYHLNKGDKVRLFGATSRGGQTVYTAALPPDTGELVLFFAIERLFYVKNRDVYAYVSVFFDDGGTDRFPLLNDFSLEPYLAMNGPFTCNYTGGENSNVATGMVVYWCNQKDRKVRSLKVEFTKLGIISGCGLYGVLGL